MDWDPPKVARDRHDCDRPVADVLAEFLGVRAASVDLARGLKASDLTRGGEHPHVDHLTVNDLIHEWVHHDRNHFRQLLANVQAAVWPNMGNSRGFAGD
ncbi:MAG TPA: DinB family protein [Chloroflexota bacterium]|nr:DinB family protein [Chloroflexota bacterium]